MNNIRRHIYYALSAAAVGVFCASFLIFLSKRLPEEFSDILHRMHNAKSVPIGDAENPALARPLSPQQEQRYENLDEDAGSPTLTSAAQPASTHTEPHTVTASQYLVIDLTDPAGTSTETTVPFVLASRTILQKDAARAVPIASLTKLVTAVVAQNMLDQNAPIEITQRIMNVDGNTAGFRLGEDFSASELMYPLLMVSSNDAAEALAGSDPKGREDFIRSMNEWAQSIGAYHTYFADPTGLSPENVSDADDLSIIMRWIYRNRPDLIAITDTKVKQFRIHTWTNPTQLLNLSSYLGGKNGYIPQSGETAVSLLQAGNKLFAVVVLGSTDRDQDILELMREATGVAYITYESPTEQTQTGAAIDSRSRN